MFHDLRERISRTRRAVAWGVLSLLLILTAIVLPRFGGIPALKVPADALFWSLVAFVCVRTFAFVLLDPLLRHRRTATPGYARDLIVVLR